MSTFVIAEAGVNHNGDEDLALRLVEVAAESGADAVKFQTFSAEKLARRGAEKAEYQKRMTGEGDQFDLLKALEMSPALHERLFARCADLGIEFMSTAFDEDSFDFLVKLGIKRIKVPSGELTNTPFLRHMARVDLPLIVSSGMANLQEVLDAVAAIEAVRAGQGFATATSERLTLLHCTSNYPAAPADVNLRAMQTMASSTSLPVGYSDHTLGIAVSTAAVAMGASVIEKHFTIDKTLPGPDHMASLEPGELNALLASIRTVEKALGNGIKAPTETELPVRALVRRSATAARDLQAGQVMTRDDVVLLRPGTGIQPGEVDAVFGRTTARAIKAGETITWADLG